MLYEHFRFNKLVRDHVATHCREQGCLVEERTLTSAEMIQELLAKLFEELQEVQDAVIADDRAELVKELADLHTVIKVLAARKGISHVEIDAVANEKMVRKGSFAIGSFIATIKIPPGHKDIPTFMAQPVKYPYLGQVEE